MANTIQQRRDILTNWNTKNPILAEGEIGIETSSIPYKIKIGTGIDKWSILPYLLDANSNASCPYRSSIISIGESDTAGVPFTDNSPSDDIDVSSWTNVIRKTLGISIHNKGIGGQTSTEILYRFNNDVLLNKPTHCIIMWGVNDAFKPEKGVSFSQTQANTIEIINRCKTNNIVPIFGITIPTYLSGMPTENSKVDNIRSWIIGYCQTNKIAMIDFFSYFMESNSNLIIRDYIGSDNMHPNELGYKIMGKIACQFLKDILPEFIGTRSPVEDLLSTYQTGRTPKIQYNIGYLGIEGKPLQDYPALFTCLEGGNPAKWGATGFVRDLKSSAPTKTWVLFNTDTTDYFFQKGDIILNIVDLNQISIMEVTKSGFANIHPIELEKATFVTKTILQEYSLNIPKHYEDDYSFPNKSRIYNKGDIVYYNNAGSGSTIVAYLMTSDGYHQTSPNNPKAKYVQIG